MRQIFKKSDTLKALSPLQKAYSREFGEEQLSFYVEILRDIPPNVLVCAVLNLINMTKFLPTIAEIREESNKVIANVKGDESDSWAKAWNNVIKAVQSYGYDRGRERLSEKERRIVNRLGWRELCFSETSLMGTYRAQFRDIWNADSRERKEKKRIDEGIKRIPALHDYKTKIQAEIENVVKKIGVKQDE